MIWLDPDFYNPTPDSPETRLFAAIIYQALEDLLFPRTNEPNSGDKNRGEALAFFTATSGPWAKARRDACDAAGFSPEAIRAKIVAILDGADFSVPNGMQGQGKRDPKISAQNLDAARALWLHQKAPPPSTKQDTRQRKALLERLLAALESGPTSFQRLSVKLALNPSVTYDMCVRLAAQNKLVQVSKQTFALPAMEIEIDQAAAAAFVPEPIEVIRARSEQIMAELDAMRAA